MLQRDVALWNAIDRSAFDLSVRTACVGGKRQRRVYPSFPYSALLTASHILCRILCAAIMTKALSDAKGEKQILAFFRRLQATASCLLCHIEWGKLCCGFLKHSCAKQFQENKQPRSWRDSC
ncbi:hypothetical protein SUGI_0694520 [Cryptomeria japonica]|nr:hypothetical protein SUGI_0694520 [Cryptomeria japonica]